MSFFTELKRRNVVRVAIAYGVIGWLLAQVAEFAFETFEAPAWVLKSVVVMLFLGLPLTLFFAWAFELTPEGVKREKDVDRSQSVTATTGRKLDRLIIAVLVLALAWFAWDKFLVSDSGSVAELTAQTETTDKTPSSIPRVASDKSIAVLPFIAMSSGADDEYFADGLTEEILNSLAQLPELLVTARTSAFSFKGQDLPVQQIAATLGVKHLVEGSVRRAGERLRVTAQLIRATDGFHLWSENYDSTSTDTIAVQEDIAEKIAVAMDVVLDEKKRESMRLAGIRDVEAFTDFQKGRDIYNRAHGDIEMIDGLRQANRYFEKVLARVPDYAPVYMMHSDLFIHILNDDVVGEVRSNVTEEELANAYPSAIADYRAGTTHARTPELRNSLEMDLAFLSGNWRGLTGRLERALQETGCPPDNWLETIADIAGYAEPLRQRSARVLACDPRRSLSWFNSARAALWAGDKVDALRIAREGAEVAPGGWLDVILIEIMAANGLYEEATREIESRIRDIEVALILKAFIAAHQGDRPAFEALFQEYEAETGASGFFHVILLAWGGKRDETNRRAAEIDQHHFGAVGLWQIAHWCACGTPWDMESTPNLAAKLKAGNIAWPPASPMHFPLKDW